MISDRQAKATIPRPCLYAPRRKFLAKGEEWTVYECPFMLSGPSLVFEAERCARRVRRFPSDWCDLPDDALYALSWSR